MNGDIAIKRCTITDKMYRGVRLGNRSKTIILFLKYDFITQVGNRDSFISGLYVDGEFEDGSDWTEVGLAMAEWREEGATIKIVGDKK